MKIILQSKITCINCGHKKEETMSADARRKELLSKVRKRKRYMRTFG